MGTGLLSACSSVFSDVVNQSGIWKQLFEATAKRGEQYVTDPARLSSVHKLTNSTWCGEPGLAECFRMPNQNILARVGFKRALGCLLSHRCIECGLSTCTANPITMSRICDSCAKQSPQSFTLLRSYAKVHTRSTPILLFDGFVWWFRTRSFYRRKSVRKSHQQLSEPV